MNLNVVLRHELHALINRASADQLFTALHSPQSPIRDRFIKFLALSYADWLSTQNDIDDDDIKKVEMHWNATKWICIQYDQLNKTKYILLPMITYSIICANSHFSMLTDNQGDDYKLDKSPENKVYPASTLDSTNNPSNISENRNGIHTNVDLNSPNTLGGGDDVMIGLTNSNHQLHLNEKYQWKDSKIIY